ncbi:hypothetical protein [Brevibacillus agri]|uniref:hypothetical protein n=1 Tax=Brevibacillus agri TaxID=51101 RepID=UPI0018CCDFB6|nr:hypothetical protein [Brevibacillus agri]MED3501614.1 hypothetical protein [Brevibacillus agri]
MNQALERKSHLGEASGFFAMGAGIAVCVANVFGENSRQKVTRFAITSEVEKKTSIAFISLFLPIK